VDGLKPKKGTLTFDSEGQEGGPYHSRKLHVPSMTSGLTIGRGYDMKTKSAAQIQADLHAAGVADGDAKVLSGAAGLFGQAAKDFITANKLQAFEIGTDAQVKLFDISYAAEFAEVKRISGKEDTKKAYGAVDWDKTDPAIQDVIIDLKFRGDYTSASRTMVQKYLATNDLEHLAAVLSKRENWPNVPQDRFNRRKDFINKAVDEMKKARQAAPPPARKPQPGTGHINMVPPAHHFG